MNPNSYLKNKSYQGVTKMSSPKKETDNTTEILALVNLLIRKGLITEQEFIKEVIEQKKKLDNLVSKKLTIKK
jgi:hypothetical protein